jgi:hypothetical protein
MRHLDLTSYFEPDPFAMGCGDAKPETQSVPMAQPVVVQNGQAILVQVQ